MVFDNKDFHVNTINTLSYWNNLNFYELNGNSEVKSSFVGEQLQGIEEENGCVFIAKESLRLLPEPFIMRNKLFTCIRQRNLHIAPFCDWEDVNKLAAPKTTVLTSNGKVVFPKMQLKEFVAPRLTVTPSALRNGSFVTNRTQKLQFGKPSSLFLPNGLCANKDNVRLRYGNDDSNGDEILVLKPSSFKRKGENVTPMMRPAKKRNFNNEALKKVLNISSDPMQNDPETFTKFGIFDTLKPDGNYEIVYPSNPKWVPYGDFATEIPSYVANKQFNVLPGTGTVTLVGRVIPSGSVLTGADLDDLLSNNQINYWLKAGILKEV